MKIDSISLNPSQCLILVFVATILHRVSLDSVSALCEFSIKDRNKLYNYSLATPLRKFPHGILSEEGFYKVSANGTVLWFQLCSSMIFNHEPPMCVDCKDCGGPSGCGMGCSALVSNKIEGYPVCTTLGHPSTVLIDVLGKFVFSSILGKTKEEYSCLYLIERLCCIWALTVLLPSCYVFPLLVELSVAFTTAVEEVSWHNIFFFLWLFVTDKKSPHLGIIVKMTNNGLKHNCSLSVSVTCKSNGVQAPQTLEAIGFCDYTTELKHPSGCAKIISSHGNGLGWFGTFLIIILCLFGGYLLAGTVYRYFFLRVHGIDVIPNLEFWASLPHRLQTLYLSLVRRVRGASQGYRSSYSPVNF